MQNDLAFCGAIILAGGRGERFQQKKQFCELQGKPLWKHVYDKMVQVIPSSNIIVVGVDIDGGQTRTESVIKGLKALPNVLQRVIIAEAARPLITVGQIKILAEDKHPSTTFVMPLVNTVIMRNGNYLNRDDLYQLLTPQAFDYSRLVEAYASQRFRDMTDETRVMYEYHKCSPFFIETTDNLIKITYPNDLPIVEKLLEMENAKNG